MSIKGTPTMEETESVITHSLFLKKEQERQRKLLNSPTHKKALENFLRKTRWLDEEGRLSLANFLKQEREHQDQTMFSSMLYLSLTGSLYPSFPSIHAITLNDLEPQKYDSSVPFAYTTLSKSKRERLFAECQQAAELLLALPENTFNEKIKQLEMPDSSWEKTQKKMYENFFWASAHLSLTLRYITGQHKISYKENPNQKPTSKKRE